MNKQIYQIPIKFRKRENMHILFWLIKDISWALEFKTAGIIMIFPTLFLAILITFQTKNNLSELYHNLAVISWLIANSYWMISEFYGFDTHYFYSTITYKKLALIPFFIGLILLIYFYCFKNNKSTQISQN